MPFYDYGCQSCGVFTASRPIAEFNVPVACPECGEPAARAFTSAPAIFGMDGAKRKAIGINERSANEPKSSRSHGAGCSCCLPRLGAKAEKQAANAAKSFPSARPWMISH